jgi:hypothetical protein
MNRNDFNEELEGGSMSSVRPGWEEEPIMKEWAWYAKSQMGKWLTLFCKMQDD